MNPRKSRAPWCSYAANDAGIGSILRLFNWLESSLRSSAAGSNAATPWWNSLRGSNSGVTLREGHAHLWTAYPRSRATAEYGAAEPRQYQKKFGKFGPQDRRADPRIDNRNVKQNGFSAPRPVDRHDRDLKGQFELNATLPFVRLGCHSLSIFGVSRGAPIQTKLS